MTREEVLEEIKNYENYPNGLSKECRDYIIKALEQEPRKDEVILTKEEYGKLVSSEFDNGYAKGYREALDQDPILDKIFSIVHPVSIMSTPELEHKAIMQIAEMLEPLCLPESEEE